MDKIEFQTTRGSKVTIEVVTQEPSIHDRHVMVACFGLEVTINGKQMIWGGTRLAEHPQAGTCLAGFMGSDFVPVPADMLPAVKAMLDGYKAEVARRVDTALARDAVYQADHDAIEMTRVTGRAN